jgi:hypothetical protein
VIFQSDPYVALMASLPAIGLLAEKAPPINRDRLEARLRALTPEDREEVEAMRALLVWEAFDTVTADAAYLARAERLIARLRSAPLREAARERLELRTIVAALRRRHAGEEAPPAEARWGYGRHLSRIRANWASPDFGLGRMFPWIAPARDMLEAGDVTGLERLLLETAWRAIERRAFGHAFDLEAVVFYLMRWSLADRWARYDADAAAARFAEALEAALADAREKGRAA